VVLFSASLAAVIVWLVNRQMVNLLGNKAIVAAAPFIEELFKSGTAVLLKVPLVALHGVFGLLEGFYDLAAGAQVLPAIIGVFSHLFFGWATSSLMKLVGFWPAWFLSA